MKANLLILNRFNALYNDGAGFASLWTGANKDLEAALDSHGAEIVQVKFQTYSPETAKADIAKYTRRLSALKGWKTTEFANAVINGHVQTVTFVCELRKGAYEAV